MVHLHSSPFIPTAELNPTPLHSPHTLPCIPHPFIHPRMLPFTTTCLFLLSYSFIHFHILSFDLNLRIRSNITSFILTPRRARERWSRHARARAPSPRFTYTVCHSPQQPLLNPIFLHSFYTPPCMPHPFIHPRMFPFTNVCIRLLLYSFNTSTLLHST